MASDNGDRVTHLRESLQRIVEPVREELAEIEKALERIEQERQELLVARREAQAVIRAADPAERAKFHARPPKPKSGGRLKNRVAQDRLTDFGTWLALHRNEFPEGFTAPELIERGEGPITEKTTVIRALDQLADDGVLRLDGYRSLKPDGSRIQGRRPRVYKVVGK